MFVVDSVPPVLRVRGDGIGNHFLVLNLEQQQGNADIFHVTCDHCPFLKNHWVHVLDGMASVNYTGLEAYHTYTFSAASLINGLESGMVTYTQVTAQRGKCILKIGDGS